MFNSPSYDKQAIQILVIATFHMANPGQDIHNVEAVDVLTPQRQAEIQAVTTALARFKPNRVAVEWPADVVNERYAKFLAGTLPESRNEVVQLGFRLACDCEIPRVLGLDVPGVFPFGEVQAWAEANGRVSEIEHMLAEGATEVAKLTALQNETSIGGVLRYLNEPASIARNHAFYPPLLSVGADAEQPGVVLLSSWYGRNLGICARLLQGLELGDRVVVFYGQGHVYLLQQFLGEQPGVELVDPLQYLPES